MILNNATSLIADLAKTVLDDPKPDEFLSHITNKTLSSLDARGAMLGVIEREGFLDLQGIYGFSDKVVEPYMRVPLWSQMPITDAARSGKTSIFKSATELVGTYPHLHSFGEPNNVVTISAPIIARNTVIGAIGLTVLKVPQDGFEYSATTQGVLALCGIYIRSLLNKKVDSTKYHSSSVKSLSPRQKNIIHLFEDDLTTDQMAEKLKYSASTIKQDIIKIYSIFGVNSRKAVIELAKRAGLS